MSLSDIFAALKAGGARYQTDLVPDGSTYRATLGQPKGEDVEWLVENAALPDMAAVEQFFRDQAAIHFPNITLPA